MAFYKKVLKKISNKWYPQSVLVGNPVDTEQIAKRLSAESTVSRADVYAVLIALGGVMGEYMAQGRSVKLTGIGTFYFTATSTKNGVATEKEVTAKQINGVRVRFIPETRFRPGSDPNVHRVAVRSLSDVRIDWEEWKGVAKKKKKVGGSGH
ncbi:HU family DNA-binding protein [Hoylesella enoeca]|uniref:HU family DNA-binding protein n=1 Tax=Hoylesella enoeca TaxID=76123 RepID=UPI00288C5E9E|nr:HU family DNA-binding protein [Hoylesella enoeca]